jgi:type II secretory pathway component PulJ
MHLAISLSSYILFFVARTLMPTQQADWRLQENAQRPQSLG